MTTRPHLRLHRHHLQRHHRHRRLWHQSTAWWSTASHRQQTSHNTSQHTHRYYYYRWLQCGHEACSPVEVPRNQQKQAGEQGASTETQCISTNVIHTNDNCTTCIVLLWCSRAVRLCACVFTHVRSDDAHTNPSSSAANLLQSRGEAA